jgi:fatty acid desaturase
MDLEFTPRGELSEYEWSHEGRNWKRMGLDVEVVRKLSERSTWNGLCRVGLFVVFLAITVALTVLAAQQSLWLAIIPLYGYYFLYGFWVAIAHELQHKTVFARNFDWFSEPLFFLVQALMWNSPRYARKSHQLHHRYTMVRGIDPETDWPEVITSKWLRSVLLDALLRILVVGAVKAFFKEVLIQIRRSPGQKDRMMTENPRASSFSTLRCLPWPLFSSAGSLFCLLPLPGKLVQRLRGCGTTQSTSRGCTT